MPVWFLTAFQVLFLFHDASKTELRFTASAMGSVNESWVSNGSTVLLTIQRRQKTLTFVFLAPKKVDLILRLYGI